MKNNILIIDDDAEVRSLISDVLSDEGYATFPVSNETEAFSNLKKNGIRFDFFGFVDWRRRIRWAENP